MPSSTPDVPLQSPIAGITMDASLHMLGLSTELRESGHDSSHLSRSLSGSFVKRTVEKTKEKFSRNGRRPRSVASEEQIVSGHRRIFSLSRKGKDKGQVANGNQDEGEGSHICIIPARFSQFLEERHTPKRPQSAEAQTISSTSISAPSSSPEDSPFIRPSSPSDSMLRPIRPSLVNFRGSGSVSCFSTPYFADSQRFIAILRRCVRVPRRSYKRYKPFRGRISQITKRAMTQQALRTIELTLKTKASSLLPQCE